MKSDFRRIVPEALVPLAYGTLAILLLLIARRAGLALGARLTVGALLDPRHFQFGELLKWCHGLALLGLMMSVLRRSQLLILVTLQALFVFSFLDVLRETGTIPTKIDFRLYYQVEVALQLVWMTILSGVASAVVAVRRRRSRR